MILTLKEKKRVKRLYKHSKKGKRVICYDEFAPIELRPSHGSTWSNQTKPERLPATYTRKEGVRNFLSSYDLTDDKLWGYFKERKRWNDVLSVLKLIRRRYPTKERLYFVMENFSPHKRSELEIWSSRSNVEIEFTPTNASWLNRIECQFTEMKKFVFDNTNFQSHQEVKKSMYKFLGYRNRRNKKRNLINLKRH